VSKLKKRLNDLHYHIRYNIFQRYSMKSFLWAFHLRDQKIVWMN